MQKSIVILTNIPAPYRVDLFNYLIDNYKEAYKFNILYTAKEEDDRGWELDNKKIRNSTFIRCKSFKIKKNLDNKHIHFPFNIVKVLNNKKPDVVIASEYNLASVLSYIWCKVNRKKFISWSDGTLNSEKNISKVQLNVRKLFCRTADAFIASSTKTKEVQQFYGANKNRIYTSYLTTNIDNILYEKINSTYNNSILFVGRLSERKGLDLLLKALKCTKSSFKLIVVGDGPEKENLINLSKKLELNEQVKFLGAKSGEELKNIYKKVDVFILPSREDCFGLVITEAMCSSLPIISSKYADGAYDLVENNKNGFIIDPYDEIEFAKKIDYILLNKEKRIEFGKNSFEKAKQFSFNNVSKQFIGAIDSVLD